jgi:hypothetical protein
MEERQVIGYASITAGMGLWTQPDDNSKMFHTDCGGYIQQVLHKVSGLPRVERFEGNQAFWRSFGMFTVMRESWTETQREEGKSKGITIALPGDTIKLDYTRVPFGLTVALIHTRNTDASWGNFTHVGILDMFASRVYHLADVDDKTIRSDTLNTFLNVISGLSNEVYFVRLPVATIMNGENLRDDDPALLESYTIIGN